MKAYWILLFIGVAYLLIALFLTAFVSVQAMLGAEIKDTFGFIILGSFMLGLLLFVLGGLGLEGQKVSEDGSGEENREN